MHQCLMEFLIEKIKRKERGENATINQTHQAYTRDGRGY
jgi:hypothetical protein